MPTWMDGVSCVGTESRLSECPFNGWGNEDCSHDEDAMVDCWGDEGGSTPRPDQG